MADRMAGVSLVTVSLRRSMIVSGMRIPLLSDRWAAHSCLARKSHWQDRRVWRTNSPSLLLLLLIFQIPAASNLAKKHLAIRDAFEGHLNLRVILSPAPFPQESAELLHFRGIARQFSRGFLDQFLESASMNFLDPFINPSRIAQLGQKVIDFFLINGFENGRQHRLRLGLRIVVQVNFNAIAH